MKKFIKYLLPLTVVTSSFATVSISSCSSSHLRLTRTDWEDQTKKALNDCIANYGIDGKNYSKDNYVVFDFDNTSAIFDIAHICTTYQIERMAYEISKDEMFNVLSADLGDIDRSLPGYAFTYRDIIEDIVSCYSNLQTRYGPFTHLGVDANLLQSLHNDNDWKDFAAKLRYMYSVVANIQGDKERCKWGTYQFSGMTPKQVYDLECKCLTLKQQVESKNETWTAVTPIKSTGVMASAKFIQGISVTENIKELYKAIKENGINIWIVSASQIDQVLAAADVFGLSQYVSGAIALTNKLGDSGKYISQYDSANGKGYIRKDNKWVQMDKSNPHFTSGLGKSLAIKDVIAPNYNNKGPIMCFGDSTGDFNFCTEFKDTKLVVCFNRADRSVKDGGGLMSALAIYQKINDINLEKANANNDTLYCLQGRDENNRLFRNSNKTVRLGYNIEHLFLEKNNYSLLSYIMSNELSIADACKLSLIQSIEGMDVGFLDQYNGYHSR